MRSSLGDYLDELARGRDAAAICATLFGRTAAMGYDCGIVGELAPGPDGPTVRALHVASMTEEFRDYLDGGLYRHDPLFARLLTAEAPFEMGPAELRAGASTPERRRLLGYGMIGTKRRVTLPPVAGDGTVWALSFGADVGAPAAPDGDLWLAAAAAAARLMEIARAQARPSPLTPRERECLLLLASGLRVDRIAERLGLSTATVEMHLANARRRVGARTSPEAVAKAIVRGWIAP